MSAVIKVENLSKKYIISHQGLERYTALRDVIMEKLNGAIARIRYPLAAHNQNDNTHEEFWALKNINFEIKQGERVGIIGRNGAGKSTLLKILSRITEPTTGRIRIRGRIASLLEVGTGFHPELTGRENIFLNGAILGMGKAEIKKKFDEIVAFAEVEKFLDTPVKRYSSGMYVRLAFAVASHLEPEILVVDEVLAVGDTIFQKKCIDRMMEVSGQGRTILFVSHNFSAVKALCSKTMLLKTGKITFSGDVDQAIDKYSGESFLTGKEISLIDIERRGTAQELIFDKLTFLNYPVHFGEPIKFKIKLKSTGIQKMFTGIDFGFAIRDRNLNTIIHCSNRYLNFRIEHVSDDIEYLIEIENILKPDIYYLVFFLRSEEVIQDWLTNEIKLEINDGNKYGFYDTKQIQGAILPKFNITLIKNI